MDESQLPGYEQRQLKKIDDRIEELKATKRKELQEHQATWDDFYASHKEQVNEYNRLTKLRKEDKDFQPTIHENQILQTIGGKRQVFEENRDKLAEYLDNEIEKVKKEREEKLAEFTGRHKKVVKKTKANEVQPQPQPKQPELKQPEDPQPQPQPKQPKPPQPQPKEPDQLPKQPDQPPQPQDKVEEPGKGKVGDDTEPLIGAEGGAEGGVPDKQVIPEEEREQRRAEQLRREVRQLDTQLQALYLLYERKRRRKDQNLSDYRKAYAERVFQKVEHEIKITESRLRSRQLIVSGTRSDYDSEPETEVSDGGYSSVESEGEYHPQFLITKNKRKVRVKPINRLDYEDSDSDSENEMAAMRWSIRDLPRFTGESTSGQTAMSHMMEFKDLLKHMDAKYHLNEEAGDDTEVKDIIGLFVASMQGKARQWFELTFKPNERETMAHWKAISKKFLDYYNPVGSTPELKIRAWKDMKWDPAKESFDEFRSRFKQLGDTLGYTEEQMKQNFLCCIPHSLLGLTVYAKTMEEIVECIQRGIGFGYGSKPDPKPATTTTAATTTTTPVPFMMGMDQRQPRHVSFPADVVYADREVEEQVYELQEQTDWMEDRLEYLQAAFEGEDLDYFQAAVDGSYPRGRSRSRGNNCGGFTRGRGRFTRGFSRGNQRPRGRGFNPNYQNDSFGSSSNDPNYSQEQWNQDDRDWRDQDRFQRGRNNYQNNRNDDFDRRRGRSPSPGRFRGDRRNDRDRFCTHCRQTGHTVAYCYQLQRELRMLGFTVLKPGESRGRSMNRRPFDKDRPAKPQGNSSSQNTEYMNYMYAMISELQEEGCEVEELNE